jgi:hypothetical protein
VANTAHVERVFRDTLDAFGRIDVVVSVIDIPSRLSPPTGLAEESHPEFYGTSCAGERGSATIGGG